MRIDAAVAGDDDGDGVGWSGGGCWSSSNRDCWLMARTRRSIVLYWNLMVSWWCESTTLTPPVDIFGVGVFFVCVFFLVAFYFSQTNAAARLITTRAKLFLLEQRAFWRVSLRPWKPVM